MNIAVIDVAAESGGAVSVLHDFTEAVRNSPLGAKHQWFVFTGTVSVPESENLKNIRVPEVKRSRFHRLLWEKFVFPKLMKQYRIDTVVSLQNKALPRGKWKQVVYFHNVLLLQKRLRYSLLKKEERPFAVYTQLIGPMTRKSWKHASLIVVQTETVAGEIRRYLKKGTEVAVIPPALPEITVENVPVSRPVDDLIYPAAPVSFKRQADLVGKLELPDGKKLLLTFTGDENAYARRVFALAGGREEIHFVGYRPREEIWRRYAEGQSGLIVLSDMESYPIPFAEAMRFGVPIVAVEHAYAKEVLQGYENVYFVRTDLSDLNEAVAAAFSAPKCAPRVVANADAWEEFLRKIVGE